MSKGLSHDVHFWQARLGEKLGFGSYNDMFRALIDVKVQSRNHDGLKVRIMYQSLCMEAGQSQVDTNIAI